MLSAAYRFLNGEIVWLTLLGDVDRGKTHIAIGICQKWLAMNKPAKYCFVPILLDELRAGFKETGDDSYESKFSSWSTH